MNDDKKLCDILTVTEFDIIQECVSKVYRVFPDVARISRADTLSEAKKKLESYSKLLNNLAGQCDANASFLSLIKVRGV